MFSLSNVLQYVLRDILLSFCSNNSSDCNRSYVVKKTQAKLFSLFMLVLAMVMVLWLWCCCDSGGSSSGSTNNRGGGEVHRTEPANAFPASSFHSYVKDTGIKMFFVDFQLRVCVWEWLNTFLLLCSFRQWREFDELLTHRNATIFRKIIHLWAIIFQKMLEIWKFTLKWRIFCRTLFKAKKRLLTNFLTITTMVIHRQTRNMM